MAVILSIETATTVCSVALARDGKTASVLEVDEGYSHAENITVFIEKVLKENQIGIHELDAIAVSCGPGSYTGLRIGLSTAKGLCYTSEKPLIAVSTLMSLANSCRATGTGRREAFLVPMIDARRMEVYTAVYDHNLNEINKVEAVVLGPDFLAGLTGKISLVLFGDGSEKAKSLFAGVPGIYFEEVRLSAEGMVSLAEEKFQRKEFEDVSLFEPYYLKDATIGKRRDGR